ncbi:MAG: hypothetical protein WCQ57_13820 [Verrucomicrobiota bacterium]
MEPPVQIGDSARSAINVGGVGQFRDNDSRASYALYDFESRILSHRRGEYDMPAPGPGSKSRLPTPDALRLKKGR